MKTITLSKRSKVLQRLFNIAQEEDVVVRTPEGDQFFVSLIDDFAHEIALQRKDRKLMAFLDARFRAARQGKCIPLEEVDRKLSVKPKARTAGEKKRRQT
jgi:hypothetical protein